jgi:hypothetical protein
MPSAARQRWLGKGDPLSMCKIAKQAHQRNREPSYGTDATQVWSTEFQINTRESLRVELRRLKTRFTLELRRWFKPPDGIVRPTERGFAISARHVQVLNVLIKAAIAHAEAAGLLDAVMSTEAQHSAEAEQGLPPSEREGR